MLRFFVCVVLVFKFYFYCRFCSIFSIIDLWHTKSLTGAQKSGIQLLLFNMMDIRVVSGSTLPRQKGLKSYADDGEINL